MTEDAKPVHTGATCTCCGATDGVERDGNEGVAVDEASGLCLYCQPCPHCGRTGMACDDARGPNACDPTENPEQPRLPQCRTCGENLAPGHLRWVGGPQMYEACPGGQPLDWRSIISGVSP